MDSEQHNPAADPRQPRGITYADFIKGWQALADNTNTPPREQAAARFYLKLSAMPDGEKRIDHFLGRAMKARMEDGKLYLLGYEKSQIAEAAGPLVTHKAERKVEKKILKSTLSPGDASESEEYTRREWGGRASNLLGWAMLVTLVGKQGLDRLLGDTTDKVRQMQLRGVADHIQKNPPPQNDPQAEAKYYEELDTHIKGLVGTVRDQHPWLNVISATGAGILIHFGGKSREKARFAQDDLIERSAHYTAQVGADAIEKAIERETSRGPGC